MSYTIALASSYEELCQSYALVHARYVELGYTKPHPSGMRYSPYQLLPVSTTFVVLEEDSVSGTASVISDSEAGLPSESLFPSQFAAFRGDGRTLVEGSMFACAKESSSSGKLVNLSLMRAVFWNCVARQVDSLFVVVNPRHLFFYTRMLGFEEIQSRENCAYVNGAAGHLLHLDMKGLFSGSVVLPRAAEKFFEFREEEQLKSKESYSLTAKDAAELISKRPELLREMTRPQRRVFARHFGVFFMAGLGSQAETSAPGIGALGEDFIGSETRRVHAIH